MTGVRSLLQRVKRLEAAGVAPKSPFEIAYGSMDAFAGQLQGGIDAGTLDQIDMPVVLACIRRWHAEGVYGLWQHDRIWELS